jgi:hypothetical protein
MNRATIQSYLAKVERLIADGDQTVARRRRMIADLDQEGRDTTHARKLLADLENLQHLHITDRDRLRRQLAESSE